MNNLDTQTVKGIVGENSYFFSEKFLLCIKTERTGRSGRNQSNDLRKQRPSKILYTVKTRNVGRCKRDLKFIIQYHLRI